MCYECYDLEARYRKEIDDGDTRCCCCYTGTMIDTSLSSIRVFFIMVLAIAWLIIFNIRTEDYWIYQKLKKRI